MTAKRQFHTLDLMRGVAAGVVLLWHLSISLFAHVERIWSAYLSVDLFFLLSGVVIAHAYEERLKAGWNPFRFTLARVIRLWPLYLLGTAIGAGIALAMLIESGASAPWQFKPLLLDGAFAAALLPRLVNGASAFPLNPPGWSLAFEMFVNLAYAFGGYRLSTRALAGVAILGIIVMAWQIPGVLSDNQGLNFGHTGDTLLLGLGRVVFAFPLGVVLYRLFASGRLPQLKLPPLAIAAIFVALLFVRPGDALAATLVAMVTAVVAWPLLVVAGMNVDPVGWQLRAAQRSGDLSFALYAVHAPIFEVGSFVSASFGVSKIVTQIVAALAAVLLASVAVPLFDKPVRRWLTRRLTVPATAVSAAPAL